MKLETVAGIAMVCAFLAAGTIILFGKLSQPAFGPWYFLFVAFLLAIILIFNRHRVKKKDLAFILIAAVVLCIAFSLAMIRVKQHYDNMSQTNKMIEELIFDISQGEKNLTYYSDYIDYLEKQIESYVNSSQSMKRDISSLKEELNRLEANPDFIEIIEEVPYEVIQPIQEQPPIEYREEEQEEEYEDHEDDDD